MPPAAQPLSSGPALFRRFLAQVRRALGLVDKRAGDEHGAASGPSELAAHYRKADVALANGEPAAALESTRRGFELEFGVRGPDVISHLLALLEGIAVEPPKRWRHRAGAFATFGFALAAQGASDADLARIRASLAGYSPHLDSFLTAALDLLGFRRPSPQRWLERVFEQVALPWLHALLAAGRCHEALVLETLIYEAWVKRIETEAHFRASFERWKEEMGAAGRRLAARLPVAERKPPGKLPRVAFLVHNVVRLAHVQMLLEVLEGHRELPQPMVEPFVFHYEGTQEAIEDFVRAGVPVEALGVEHGYEEALARLHRRAAEEGIDVLAWVSYAGGMPFAFAMRIAPRQVWWAMKYRALETPDIDDYVSGGSQEGGTKLIEGRNWRVGPVASSQWFAPQLAPEAARLRTELGSPPVVFGSFGREEKLSDPRFVDAVAAILRARPEAIFLWTGRTRLEGIEARFRAAGVADRTRFIGWVDTKAYAQVIDAFLDSFPFPCGFTLYEAMAAAKPVVLFASAESEHNGIHAMVGPLLEADASSSDKARRAQQIFAPESSEPLYLRARTPEEYVAIALRLADDPGFRGRAGAAARRFIDELMSDRREAARIYLGHLLGHP